MEDPLNLPSEWLCCRGCLATPVKLIDIHDAQLAQAFGHITGLPVLPHDRLPQHLCEICSSLLAKSVAFREKCHRAHHCLQIVQADHELTPDYIQTVDRLSNNLLFNLSVTPIEIMELGTSQTDIKNEQHDSFPEANIQTKIETIDTCIMEVECIPHGHSEDITEWPDFSETMDKVPPKILPKKRVRKPRKKVKVKAKAKKPVEKKPLEKKLVEKKKRSNKVVGRRLIKKRDRSPAMVEEDVGFDIEQFQNEFNVDIKVLNMEEQHLDWQQRNARKVRPSVFRCDDCGRGFEFREPYENHLWRHNPSSGAYACEICAVRFVRNTKRRSHQRDRHAVVCTCRACQFVSHGREQARLHFSTHAGKRYDCEHCEKTFLKMSSYFSHMHLAHAAQNVACGDCGESFVGYQGLRQHQIRLHKLTKADVVKCACEACGVVFDNAAARDAHTRTADDRCCDPALRPCTMCGESLWTEEAMQEHNNEKHTRFQCSECQQSFSSLPARETHLKRAHRYVRKELMKSARTRKLYVCETCGKHCQSGVALIAHRLTHTGEKPFPCSDCDRRFACPANLRRHHTVIHLGERRPGPCPQCGELIPAASLTWHISSKHSAHKPPPRPRRKRARNTEQ